jgi:acid phosphatase (class A)
MMAFPARPVKLALILLAGGIVAFSGGNALARESVMFPSDGWGKDYELIVTLGPKILPRDFDTNPESQAAPESFSYTTQAELDVLRRYKFFRTPDQVEYIKQEQDFISPAKVFEAHGLYSPAAHPAVEAFLDAVTTDVSFFIIRDKKYFRRARPAQITGDLFPVIPSPAHASYPSGHATQAYFLALTLAHLDPVNSEKYVALAKDIAWRREVAGIHYPTDSAAGFALALILFDEFSTHEKTAGLLAAAKTEF